MRLFTFLLALLALNCISCSDEKGEETIATPILDQPVYTDTTSPVEVNKDIDTVSTQVATPEFSNPAVGKSIEDYRKIKDAYIKALEVQDAVKIQNLNMAYLDWYQQTEVIVGQLKGDELKSYKKVLAQLNQEWEVAAEQATQ